MVWMSMNMAPALTQILISASNHTKIFYKPIDYIPS